MIPRADILEWRQTHPWQGDAQVEQDLLLSRALIDIFSDEMLSAELAFRGGTALHKLFLSPPHRYSEDIDLVQINADPNRIVSIFQHYMDIEGRHITRQEYLNNLELKLNHPGFLSDMNSLLVGDVDFDMYAAEKKVKELLVSKLK